MFDITYWKPKLYFSSILLKYNLVAKFLFKAMAEMMAENYHNIWAKKNKLELEAKGNIFKNPY